MYQLILTQLHFHVYQYIVTYNVIFWSVNSWNIITDKCGIFSCDAVFLFLQWNTCHQRAYLAFRFTKFNYRWGAYDTSSPFPTHLDAFGVSQQWVLVVFIFEQDVVGISAVMRVVFYRCLGIHIMRQRAIYENMTSSTKPEVHNVSQRLQRRTEPGPYAACTNIWWSSACGFRVMQADN